MAFIEFAVYAGIPGLVIGLNIWKSFHDRKTKLLAEREKLLVFAEMRQIEKNARDADFERQRLAIAEVGALKRAEMEARKAKGQNRDQGEASASTVERQEILAQDPVEAPVLVNLPDNAALEAMDVFTTDDE